MNLEQTSKAISPVDKELLGEHVADIESHQMLQSNRQRVDALSETHIQPHNF